MRTLSALLWFGLIPFAAQFASQRKFAWILDAFGDTKFHDQQIATALCITQFNYLRRNYGLGGRTPAYFEACPYESWFKTLGSENYRNQISQAISTLNAYRQFVEEPDLKAGLDNDPYSHYDAERLVLITTSSLIRARRGLLQSVASAANGASSFDAAQQQLGYILHTVQDFYSHTNWVELGYTTINSAIGISEVLNISLNPRDSDACRPCYANETLSNETASIQASLAYLDKWPGGASPSNVVVCRGNVIATGLTAGYVSSEAGLAPKPVGKCSRGMPDDDGVQLPAYGGLGKDGATPIVSPHYYLHQQAAQLAVEATIKYFEDLRVSVNDEEAFGELIGLNFEPVMAILIDTTGSMSSSIAAVKQFAQQMVLDAASNNEKEFYITPLNDPEYGPVYRFTDPQALVNFIGTLYAHDGGDTPEKCFAALLDTVRAVPAGTNIYVFTDASSKDPELKNVIATIATQKQLHISFMMSGEYVKAELLPEVQGTFPNVLDAATTMQDYKDLAIATDGTYLVASGYSEIAKATGLMTQTNWQYVFLTNVLPNNTTQLVIDVDDTVEKVEISLTFGSTSAASYLQVVLTDSTGASLFGLQNGTLAYDSLQYRAYRLNATSNSPWTLTVTNTLNLATTKLAVRVQSFLSSSLLVYDSNYEPYTGAPLIGQTYHFIAECRDCLTVNSLKLSGCTTGTLVTQQVPVPASSIKWWSVENVTLPSLADQLCVELIGTTSTGQAFRRVVEQKLALSTLEITGNVFSPRFNNSGQVYPGDNALITWTVRYVGSGSVSFSISVTNSAGFPVIVGSYPTVLTAGSTVSGNVTVRAVGSEGDSSTVEITAISSTAYSATTDFTVLIVDPNPDLYAPVCTVWNTTVDICSPNPDICSSQTYTVDLTMSDVGTGIARVMYETGNWTLTGGATNFTAQPNITFSFHGELSCCDSAIFNVVDGVGLVGTCEVDVSLWTTTPSLPATSRGPLKSCPFGWYPSTANSLKCYYVDDSGQKDFFVAQTFCRNIYPGAQIISVANAFENNNIKSLVGFTPFWLGLQQSDARTWQWTDGYGGTYRNWAPGQPNNALDCSYQDSSTGYWLSDNCYESHAAACELDLS